MDHPSFTQVGKPAGSVSHQGVGGIEREITKVERRAFRGGRVVEFANQVVTRVVQDGFSQTVEVVDLPTLDCTCAPQSILDDVYQCQDESCEAIVCSRHVWTCSGRGCGRVFCSQHVVAVEQECVLKVVCVECDEALRVGMLERCVRALLGL